MPIYHPAADLEFDDLLALANLDLKYCFGMMMKRHVGIDNASAGLSLAEQLPASDPNLNQPYEVEYSVGSARLVAVYEAKAHLMVEMLALDGFAWFGRLCRVSSDPDVQARAWARA